MVRITPPQSVNALDIDALRAAEITFYSAWQNDLLVGCGALKALRENSGEIKSMRTVRAYRSQGVAAQILEHLIDEALRRGYIALRLETGAMPAFANARALYSRYGFEFRGPFADYTDDPNSVFMEKIL